MEQKNNSAGKWKIIAIAAICLLVLVCAMYASNARKNQTDTTGDAVSEEQAPAEKTSGLLSGGTEGDALSGTEAEEPSADVTTAEAVPEKKEEPILSGDEMLSLWTEGAKAKKELISYIESVTDESGKDFIPVEHRIAVFDLDGTLFCETDPNYFDYNLLVHRVLEDEEYKDKASDFERETAEKIVEQNKTGASFDGLEVDHGKCVASSFAGMTLKEFNDYIQEFKKTPMPSYEGMNNGEGWYQPMLQVVDYLQANDFTIYVISGTDRFIVRGIVYDSPLDIPMRQVIGSDETVVASNEGDVDGLKYTFTEDDKLILGGEFIVKNLKMNKVKVIAQEIGDQPVLSFGNSTGDASMAEYSTSGNPYKSLAFMLCCDDLERENGNIEKADKMAALCEEFDWVPISMKNDWTTIYGDGVTKINTPSETDQTDDGAQDSAESADEAADEAAAPAAP